MDSKAQAGLTATIVFLGLAAFGFTMLVITMDELDTASADLTSETFLSNVNTVNTLTKSPSSWQSLQVYNQTWLDFDGVDDRVVFNDLSYYSPSSNNFRGSLSLWIYMNPDETGDGSAGSQYIVNKGTSGNYEYDIRRYNSTGAGAPNYLRFSEWNISDSSLNAVDIIQGYNFSQWYYVTVVLNGTDILTYNDRVRFTSENIQKLQGEGTSPLYLAYRGSTYFNGSLDDFRYCNYSLTPAQIIELYRINQRSVDKLIPVINYHFIGEGSEYYINETEFSRQLQFLNDSGYETITDYDYYNWTQGNIELPERPIMFVFDDEHNSVIENATKLMIPYGYVGVVAVSTEDVGTLPQMSWDNLTDLVNVYNWTLASHSQYHCDMARDDLQEKNCTSTNDRQGNLSASYLDIVSNTGFTPITFVHPFNSWNTTTIEDCLNNYTICFQGAYEPYLVRYIDKNSINDRTLHRMRNFNYTTLEEFSDALNYTLGEGCAVWNLNENTGTIAYDSSGNSNDGTISGATWNNDGVLNTLTNGVDYTQSLSSVTPLNSEYSWSQFTANYLFTSDDIRNTVSGYSDFADYWAIIILAVVAGVVITIIFRSFTKIR